MKNIILISLVSVIGFYAKAQSDTLKPSEEVVKKSVEEAAEEALVTGNYDIVPNFTFSQFTKVSTKKKFHVHGSGFFAGFSSLSSKDLNIAEVENAVLKYNSYELGWTMFGMDVNLSRKRGWLFFSGLGLRVQQYNSDLNTAFKVVDGRTVQVPAPDSVVYSTSKLTQWYIHIPIVFEYQKKIPKTNFFVQLGVECGLKLSSKSKTMYRNDNNRKTKEKIGSDMNTNPLTVDAKAEIGFGKTAIYARYGLINLFRKGRGPEVIPVAVGVVFHF